MDENDGGLVKKLGVAVVEVAQAVLVVNFLKLVRQH